jgi:hypothetical protein
VPGAVRVDLTQGLGVPGARLLEVGDLGLEREGQRGLAAEQFLLLLIERAEARGQGLDARWLVAPLAE